MSLCSRTSCGCNNSQVLKNFFCWLFFIIPPSTADSDLLNRPVGAVSDQQLLHRWQLVVVFCWYFHFESIFYMITWILSPLHSTTLMDTHCPAFPVPHSHALSVHLSGYLMLCRQMILPTTHLILNSDQYKVLYFYWLIAPDQLDYVMCWKKQIQTGLYMARGISTQFEVLQFNKPLFGRTFNILGNVLIHSELNQYCSHNGKYEATARQTVSTG